MRDVHVRGIVWTAIAIVLVIAAVVAGVFVMLRWSGVPPGGARIPPAWLQQRPGAILSLDTPALDEDGTPRRLADFFGDGRPVLLVPSYYRCPQLCGLVMHDLLASLRRSGETRWRIVAFSIAPQETPADARGRRDADFGYAAFVGLARPDLHLLTLAPADARRLTGELGFHFETRGSEVAHPATVALVTPRGAVSRYFNGVGFDADELRVALADAAGDRLGAVTTRLALLCAHFDPRLGKHNAAVMDAARVVSLVLVLALGAWIWRHRHGGTP